MEKCLFFQYKKMLSWVLYTSYVILSLSFLPIVLGDELSTDDSWIVLTGFASLNLLLLFLFGFYHIGVPKYTSDLLAVAALLFLGGACCYTLFHQMYLWTLLLMIFTTIIMWVYRCVWIRHFVTGRFKEGALLKEESIVRFALYIVPIVLLSVICSHVENVNASDTSHYIQILYFIIVIGIISFTHILWYRCQRPPILYYKLFFDVMWLSMGLLLFAIVIRIYKNTVSIFNLLPIIGAIPLLIRHKDFNQENA